MAEDASHLIHFKDPGGNEIHFYNFNGIPFPNFPGMVDRMKRYKEFQARDDDVFILGYPKSGTNWVWEIVSMIINGTAENIGSNKMTMMLECQDLELFQSQPSPRTINTHCHFPDLPPDIIRRNCKIIYLLRNPKDVCVSHFYHQRNLTAFYNYKGEWKDYLELWLDGKVDYGSWFTYVRDWEKDLKKHPDYPAYVLYYEDLKRDFVNKTKELSAFLGKSLSEEFYKEVEKKCSFDHMQMVKDKSFSDLEHTVWEGRKENPFFRKGKIGDWKNHFTVAQNERFEAAVAKRLEGSELSFVYV